MRLSNRFFLVLFWASVPVNAAPIYGTHSEPGSWSYSSTPFGGTNTVIPGRRVDTTYAGDTLGVRIQVTDFAGPANVVEVLRQDTLTVSIPGPVLPGYRLVFSMFAEGTYALGTQSLGSIYGDLIVGGTAGSGGIFQPSNRVELIRMGFGDRIGGLASSGSFSVEETVSVAIPITGVSGSGLITWLFGATAQNNGYVDALHTMRFGGARVVDTSTGLVVQGAVITSESGFDWTAPLTSSVPEPSTYAITAAALLFVGVRLAKIHRR